MNNLESEAYKKAAKRVKAKKEFYNHLATFVVMGVFFFLLNAVTAWGSWWFYWPMLGWGIGILFHYIDVFGIPGVEQVNDSDWEEKAIQEELRKMGYSGKEKSFGKSEEEDYLDLKEMKKEKASRGRTRWDEDELV
ncbi:2TM domain-containing protein [Flavilitoribacter nigricans]|uniref:2TM domain-containing protein n=1 Tax=Flavilitoribacter nigricans (strain ATCC 23147 / DSM 23189 / NBRC 102662 / NCIMB 1420 / SS-2) TaxID=1122177 RepID=A0A2D0N2S9_FLAN2|nr:2TM domain-containing protein [Flavilitoribacter nigricans]PHN02831.1 hypothetical protein CRP01_30080 [Flavilitoribacter nigricans DSM 23189 = NBRC 102662]